MTAPKSDIRWLGRRVAQFLSVTNKRAWKHYKTGDMKLQWPPGLYYCISLTMMNCRSLTHCEAYSISSPHLSANPASAPGAQLLYVRSSTARAFPSSSIIIQTAWRRQWHWTRGGEGFSGFQLCVMINAKRRRVSVPLYEALRNGGVEHGRREGDQVRRYRT